MRNCAIPPRSVGALALAATLFLATTAVSQRSVPVAGTVGNCCGQPSNPSGYMMGGPASSTALRVGGTLSIGSPRFSITCLPDVALLLIGTLSPGALVLGPCPLSGPSGEIRRCQTIDVLPLIVVPAGPGLTWSIPIPPDPALTNAVFYHQIVAARTLGCPLPAGHACESTCIGLGVTQPIMNTIGP